MSNFCTPSSLFLFVCEWVRIGRDPPLAPGCPNLGYQPPSPSPLVFLQKIVMLKIKPKFCLKPTFLQNQTPACPGTLNGRTRHLSGTLKADPDTCLEHCLDSNNTYTNYNCGHPIYVGPLPLPPVTILFRLNFDHFLPDPFCFLNH